VGFVVSDLCAEASEREKGFGLELVFEEIFIFEFIHTKKVLRTHGEKKNNYRVSPNRS